MANKKLQGKTFTLPDKLLKTIKGIVSTFNDTDRIRYSRLSDIIKKGDISYEQLKRIKNFFDNVNPSDDYEEYRKNGGDALKNWVDEVLNDARDSVEKSKEIRSDLGAMKNQYADEHTNDKSLDREYLLRKLKIQEIIKRML